MEGILSFAKNNYIVLLIIAGFFVLALIGYLYDKHSNRDIKIDDANANEIPTEELKVEPQKPEVNEEVPTVEGQQSDSL